ncbi:MAG: helix-turn-helix transcriptional regulator [Opitutaceae bacterium]
MLKKQLGRRIAKLRQVAGLTQEKLAEKTGYSVAFVSLVERGINAPSIEGCEKIAKALCVSVKNLFDF